MDGKEMNRQKNKFLIALFALAILLFSLSSVQAQSSDKIIIKVGVRENTPLVYIDENDQPTGFFVEFLEDVAEKENWDIEYVWGTLSRALEKLNKSEIDIIVVIAYSEERARLYDYTTESVISNWGQVYVPQTSAIYSIPDLDGKRIAAIKNSIHLIKLKEDYKYFNVESIFVEVDDSDELWKLLDERKVDAVITNRMQGNVREKGYAVKKTGIVFNPVNLHYAVKKDMNEEILDRIDHHLHEQKQVSDSVYNNLLQKYFEGLDPKIKITIKSASEYDYPPFSIVTEDGKADGFSVELLRAALNTVDMDVSFYVGPWSEIKEDLAQGKIQVLPLVGRTPERELIYDFTVPYITLHGAIFVREGDTHIKTIDDLIDKEIIVMKEDNAEEFVRREELSQHIITTETFEQAFQLLSEGKHDAVITQEIMGMQLLKNVGIDNVVVASEIEGFKQDFTFAVTGGDAELLSKLNDGLSRIIIDGTFDKIHDKWLGDILKEELTEKEQFEYAQKTIKQKAIGVAKQIEIYLKGHPDKTIKDLQNDPYFQEIAVQQVGKTGYTLVMEYETLIIRFHPKNELIGVDTHTFEQIMPEIWEIVKFAEYSTEDTFGYAPFTEPDGTINDKYHYGSYVNAKTADGVDFFVFATTYLDEFEEEIVPEKEEIQPINQLFWFIGIIIIIIIMLPILVRFKIIKLEKNIIMILLGITLILIIGLFIFNTFQTTQSMKKEKIDYVIDHLSSVASSRVIFIEYYLEEQKEKIKIASTHQDLTNEELILIKNINKEFFELFVLDSNGIIIASSDESLIGLDRSTDSYFVNDRDSTYVKSIYYSETVNKNSLVISTPFKDGVLVARTDLNILNEIVTDTTGLGETGESLLAYRNGEGDAVFFTERRFEREKEAIDIIPKEDTEIPITQALLNNEAVFLYFKDYRDKPVIAITRYIGELDIGLVTKIDKQEALAPIAKTITQIWLFTIGIIFSIIVIGIVFNFFLTKALRKEVDDKTNELSEVNVNLEKTVEERTKELNEKVRKLDKSEKATLYMVDDLNETSKNLKQAHIQLQEIDKLKDDIISIAGHELKTPLTSISSLTESILENEMGKINEQQKESLSLVLKDARRLHKIIESMLNVSRLEQGRIEYHFVKVNLVNLAREILKTTTTIAKQKNISMEVISTKSVQVTADQLWITQLISNIVTNAIKYGKKNGNIWISVDKKENEAVVAIKDDGIGISNENLSKVFDKMFQVNQTRNRISGGVGFGLYVGKMIVEKGHKGKIWVESKLGKGSTFYFSLPLKKKDLKR